MILEGEGKEARLSSFHKRVVMPKLPKDAVEIDRAVVEGAVYILGDASASAAALREADSHDGPVRFWKCRGSLIVQKLEKRSDKCR